MKLSLISHDGLLQKELENTGYFHEVTICESLPADGQVVCISDRIIDPNELSIRFVDRPTHQTVFYMISDLLSEQDMQNIMNICESRNIIVIPPKLTVNQIVERITKQIFPDVGGRNERIAVFFGADSKVGTSMIAQSCAELLAQNTELKVALFILNAGSTFLRTNVDRAGLDDIKIKLFNRILTPEELLFACSKNKNVHVLQGPKFLMDIRHYHPEHVEELLRLGKEVFDVIIVDAGSDIMSGLTIGALRTTNIRYLVSTQQEAARNYFERIYSQVLKALQMNHDDFLFIANKYVKTILPSAKELADTYRMRLAATFPHLEFLGWQAEFERTSLVEHEEFRQHADVLCKLIAAQMKFEYRPQRKENWFSKVAVRLTGGKAT